MYTKSIPTLRRCVNFKFLSVNNKISTFKYSIDKHWNPILINFIYQNIYNFTLSIRNKINIFFNLYLHLTTTFKRKKLKMKKHQTWKRNRKNKNSQKLNLKKK